VQSVRGSELRLEFVRQIYDVRAEAVAIFTDDHVEWNTIKNGKERRYIDESYEKEYLSSSASSPIGDLISSL
jgi:hypothetical protein